MERRCWIRIIKCQLLVISLFVMLLGISVTVLTIITYYGKHFTVINDISLETNPYRIFHSAVFYSGICLSSILTFAALLNIVATMKELQSAIALGFLCFAVVFCASVQAAYWSITHRTEVEVAIMDVYDFVYEEVRSYSDNSRRQELLMIHETFLCCGKKSPFGEATSSIENEMCQTKIMATTKEDCLQEIQAFLKKHMSFVFILMTITTIVMVYGMILTSLFWFSMHFNSSLQRKGKYILTEQ